MHVCAQNLVAARVNQLSSVETSQFPVEPSQTCVEPSQIFVEPGHTSKPPIGIWSTTG